MSTDELRRQEGLVWTLAVVLNQNYILLDWKISWFECVTENKYLIVHNWNIFSRASRLLRGFHWSMWKHYRLGRSGGYLFTIIQSGPLFFHPSFFCFNVETLQIRKEWRVYSHPPQLYKVFHFSFTSPFFLFLSWNTSNKKGVEGILSSITTLQTCSLFLLLIIQIIQWWSTLPSYFALVMCAIPVS